MKHKIKRLLSLLLSLTMLSGGSAYVDMGGRNEVCPSNRRGSRASERAGSNSRAGTAD